jgi:quercetin dioxygenase-like cupin family protein
MEIFKFEDFMKVGNLTPDKRYIQQVLTYAQKAESIGGIFGILSPGNQVPYHFHNRRESIIIPFSGEATEIIEGKEIPIKESSIIYIPAGEKHATVNQSNKDFRYLEFFTNPSDTSDFVLA